MKNKIFRFFVWAAHIWWAAYMSARLFFPKHMPFPFSLLDTLTILMFLALAVIDHFVKPAPLQKSDPDNRMAGYILNVLLFLPFVVAVLRAFEII